MRPRRPKVYMVPRGATIGEAPAADDPRARYVAVGETIPAGARILVHTIRPAAAGVDFSTLERLAEALPALKIHPTLRGAIGPVNPPPAMQLQSTWAVYDVEAATPAAAIVAAIQGVAPRDLSFSLAYTPLATADEIRARMLDALRGAIHRIPFVGPLARLTEAAARGAEAASGWIGVGLGVAFALGVAWVLTREAA